MSGGMLQSSEHGVVFSPKFRLPGGQALTDEDYEDISISVSPEEPLKVHPLRFKESRLICRSAADLLRSAPSGATLRRTRPAGRVRLPPVFSGQAGVFT